MKILCIKSSIVPKKNYKKKSPTIYMKLCIPPHELRDKPTDINKIHEKKESAPRQR